MKNNLRERFEERVVGYKTLQEKINQPAIVFDPREIYKIEEKIEETKKIQEETTQELTKIAGGPKRDEEYPTFVSPLMEYIQKEEEGK